MAWGAGAEIDREREAKTEKEPKTEAPGDNCLLFSVERCLTVAIVGLECGVVLG